MVRRAYNELKHKIKINKMFDEGEKFNITENTYGDFERALNKKNYKLFMQSWKRANPEMQQYMAENLFRVDDQKFGLAILSGLETIYGDAESANEKRNIIVAYSGLGTRNEDTNFKATDILLQLVDKEETNRDALASALSDKAMYLLPKEDDDEQTSKIKMEKVDLITGKLLSIIEGNEEEKTKVAAIKNLISLIRHSEMQKWREQIETILKKTVDSGYKQASNIALFYLTEISSSDDQFMSQKVKEKCSEFDLEKATLIEKSWLIEELRTFGDENGLEILEKLSKESDMANSIKARQAIKEITERMKDNEN